MSAVRGEKRLRGWGEEGRVGFGRRPAGVVGDPRERLFNAEVLRKAREKTRRRKLLKGRNAGYGYCAGVLVTSAGLGGMRPPGPKVRVFTSPSSPWDGSFFPLK